jgi:hypothetical protein
MATMEQLEAEPWWNREITTSAMVGLGLQLRTAFQAGRGSVGIKGNEVHLSGGHRSQEWIKNSRYCTNRLYAVQTGLSGDELRYCSAIDFVPAVWGTVDNRNKMKLLTSRMLDSMKAGECDEVVECFGTLDGKNITGWRNDLNKVATSDTSHLDHIHVRFQRQYCNDSAVMAKVATILLGEAMSLSDEDVQRIADAVWQRNINASNPSQPKSAWGTVDATHDNVLTILEKLESVAPGSGVPVSGTGSFTLFVASPPPIVPSTTGTTAGTAGQ